MKHSFLSKECKQIVKIMIPCQTNNSTTGSTLLHKLAENVIVQKRKKNPKGSFIIFVSQSFRVQLEKMPFQDNQHGLSALYRRKRAKFWKHSKSCWRKYDHMSNLHYATLAIHFCDGPLRNKVFTDFTFKFAI